MRTLVIAIVGAAALCTVIASAQAASIGTASAVLRTSEPIIAEEVAYRRCWWRKGNRYCRRYGAYAPYYGAYRYGYTGSSVGIILGIQ
jgi:hypothetical protein